MRDPTLPVTATEPASNRRIRLSVARRMVTDYMWAASGIARVGVTRRAALGEIIAVRRRLQHAPSWTAIFAKAFALVALEIPELRRVYMKWPWPHLYEYAESTVSIMQERQIEGDTGLLPMRFRGPDALPIGAFSEMIRSAAEAPIEASKFYRNLLAVTRWPVFIRRPVWALCLSIPRLRRHTLGTYAVSSVARWQAELGVTRSPIPCLLSYGPADETGHVTVLLNFDHRIFDGALAARVLTRLDEVLNSSILDELHGLIAPEASAQPRRA
jgi:hypothetical protein